MITLKNILSTFSIDAGNWMPQVVHTVATEGTGTNELVDSIKSHSSFNKEQGIHKQKMDERYKYRLTELIKDDYMGKFWNDENISELKKALDKNHHKRLSPYDLANKMLNR